MAENGGPFSSDALPTNQSGRLTPEQSHHWSQIAKRRRQEVRGVAYVFAAMGALLLLANGPSATAARRTTGGMASLAVVAILLVAANLEPVNADVRRGRVISVEGAIAKTYRQSKTPGGRFFYLDVGGRRLRASSKAAYDAAPDAGYVRVYFFPRSRRVVNLEQLADPPIPTGPGAAQDVFKNYARALLSRDRSTIAEASAGVAALKHLVEGPPPATPTRSERSHAVPVRADDLYGTWTNPLASLSFAGNGVVTITAALGGARHDGRWSVDRDGRLLTDATGTLEPVEASLEGDRLTIVVQGQRLAFTRMPPEP
jgi:hypothetical protein